jgi:hypothetical protein
VAHFLLDTRPASISSDDIDDDITRPAEKGRPKNDAPRGKPKNGAEPSESGDETSSPSRREDSEEESSSENEDLTAMEPETIRKKLMSEVNPLITKWHPAFIITDFLLTSRQRVSLRGASGHSDSRNSSPTSLYSKANGGKASSSRSRTPSHRQAQVQDIINEETRESGSEVIPEVPKPKGKPPTKRDLNRAREVFPFILLYLMRH